MKSRWFFTFGCLMGLLVPVGPVLGQLPAFPGAQGFGRFATGGRGGSVYHVTNLNDSGAGSFRDAVSQPNRTVVFDVGGVIAYTGSRYNVAHHVTVAGQTAPGDGVMLYGDGIGYNGSDNSITRFIRYRMGINGTTDKDAVGIGDGHDMIFDHVSVSWGRDETFSVSADTAPYPTNISIQSCIISQGLQGHSAGGLIQTPGGVSILRTFYADNDTRNPKVKFVNEYVNNVVCNWETIGYNMGGDSAGDSYANAFNNYFISGPASSSSAFGGGNANFHIYATNNWHDSNKNGALDGGMMSIPSYGPMDLQSTPFAYPITNAYSPLTALKLAISDAGTSFRRDSVDERMIAELISFGTLGGTITSELVPPMNGPGIIRNGVPYADGDQDGMPDYWENGTGSNPAIANNNDPSPSASGYTRLEDYLNWLADPHGIALPNTNVVVDLRQFTRGWAVINHTPAWSVSNAVNGSVTLINGCFAQFTPTPGFSGQAGFQFTVNDTDGDTITRPMNLFFTASAQGYTPIWHGDDLANNWNVLGDFNWFDGRSLLYAFHNGDAVVFDDSGSTNPAVNLVGSLQPASLTVAATKHYVIGGSGSLDGAMALNKTNSGSLTLNNTNSYSGNTTVSNGALFVHGTLLQSPVTVRSSGTIGGNGRLGNGLTTLSGATIASGNGVGAPGTLTVTNTLAMSGGVTVRMDLSDDPSGTTKTNDQIIVVGTLSLAGVNSIQVTLPDGPLANGRYTLIKYNALIGSLANLSLIGANGVLTNPPGEIAIHVDNTRPPASLVWVGNGVNNIWDIGTNPNWLNLGTLGPDWFYAFDTVLFGDSGSTNPPVNLNGALLASGVTVDATRNYTFSGTGKISGTTGLVKTNSGTLVVSTTNDYTGPTVIGGGVLSVAQITNAALASGIGAANIDPANLVFHGGTLRYTGNSVNSDRGATLNGSGTFDIASGGTTLTWNGTNIGTGTLIKTGAGTLTVTAQNLFSGGTILSNGTLALFGPSGGATITANNYALGSGNITLAGGTLRLFGGGLGDVGAGYGTFSRPMIVPAGCTNTLLTPGRYTMSSSLSGGGTLNLQVNYVRGSLNGNWSAFSGLINVTAAPQSPGNGIAEFRIGNSSGYSNATIFLNDGAVITRSGGVITIEIGALGSTTGGSVGVGNQTTGGSSYRVGWNNADATFAGSLKPDGVNAFTKVGTGKWTLTGTNTYTGGTTINGGALLANNLGGSATGTGAVMVNNGGTLGGFGFISGAVTVNSGGTLAPGASAGTLTINSTVTLNAGAILKFELGPTNASDRVAVNGALVLGGVLNITNLAGFGPGTYTLFTYSGALSGSLPAIGSKPFGFTCTVNTNTAGQVRLLVQAQTPPTIDTAIFANGKFVMSGFGGPTNSPYYVVATTNLAVRLDQWPRIATNQFNATGAFSFTNTVNPGQPQQFYRVQLP